ncbi:MAG: hypothetical protein EP343_25180 [Deltaproteobacteria bacterium]|nr:MAG: hypothetical protein EP343_25180 [Deltaproteobacteria bacterium]
MNQDVETYLTEGCGRCPLMSTPECKVHTWHEELVQLRALLLECDLEEEVKWGVPCYTFQSKNILMLSAFKKYCTVSFFKGALLPDPMGILVKPGANTQASRQLRFTKGQDIAALADAIQAYVKEAIEVEKSGRSVEFKSTAEFEVPEEFQTRLDDDPALRDAFEALTPGRQRSYLLHFSQPKQSKTRTSRVEKCIPRIFEGKGFHDR